MQDLYSWHETVQTYCICWCAGIDASNYRHGRTDIAAAGFAAEDSDMGSVSQHVHHRALQQSPPPAGSLNANGSYHFLKDSQASAYSDVSTK